MFEDLETFNYQLSATDIATDYGYATNSMLAPPTVIITNPPESGTYFVGTNQTLTIEVNAQAASGHFVQEVDYSYGVYQQTDPPIGISTQSPSFSILWTNTDWNQCFCGGL